MFLRRPNWGGRTGKVRKSDLGEYLAKNRLAARPIPFKRRAFTVYPRALEPLLSAVDSGTIPTITNYTHEAALEGRLRKLLGTHSDCAVKPNDRIFRQYLNPWYFAESMETIAAAIEETEVLIPPGLYGDSYYFALRLKSRRSLMRRIAYDLVALTREENDALELLIVPPDADPLWLQTAADWLVKWIRDRDSEFDDPLPCRPKYVWHDALHALVGANEPLSQMFTLTDSSLDYSPSLAVSDQIEMQTYMEKHVPHGPLHVTYRYDWSPVSNTIQEILRLTEGEQPGEELTRYIDRHEREDAIVSVNQLVRWLMQTEFGIEQGPLAWKESHPWARAMADLASVGDLPKTFELDGTTLNFRRALKPRVRRKVLEYVRIFGGVLPRMRQPALRRSRRGS